MGLNNHRPGTPGTPDNDLKQGTTEGTAAPAPLAPQAPAESLANKGNEGTATGGTRVKQYGAPTGGTPNPAQAEKNAAASAEIKAVTSAVLLQFNPNVVGATYEGGLDAYKKLDPETRRAEGARLIAACPKTGNETLAKENKPLNSEATEKLRKQIMDIGRYEDDAKKFLMTNGIKSEAAWTAYRTSAVVNLTSHFQGTGNGPMDPKGSAEYFITGRTEATPAESKGKARNLDALRAEAVAKAEVPNAKDGTVKAMNLEVAAIDAFTNALRAEAEAGDAQAVKRFTVTLEKLDTVAFNFGKNSEVKGVRPATFQELAWQLGGARTDRQSGVTTFDPEKIARGLEAHFVQVDEADIAKSMQLVIPFEFDEKVAFNKAISPLRPEPVKKEILDALQASLAEAKGVLPTTPTPEVQEFLKKGVEVNGHTTSLYSKHVQEQLLLHMHAMAEGDQQAAFYFKHNAGAAALADELTHALVTTGAE